MGGRQGGRGGSSRDGNVVGLRVEGVADALPCPDRNSLYIAKEGRACPRADATMV